MNSYELSRNFFDFCFENPERISPNHIAIYFFAVEHCNRLGWKDKFGFPTQMACDAIGIKKPQTYIRYFDDLVSWGFFKLIQRSKNQYSSNIISLISALPKNGEALDKAIIKHGVKQTESMGQSNSPINKPITKEPITNEHIETFDIFRKKYLGRKRGLETEFDNFRKKHKDWQEVLPELKSLLECQINIHNMKKANKLFAPEWKNLQTWINQRCWEDEEEEPNLAEEKKAYRL